VETSRDHLVYAISEEQLQLKISEFAALPDNEARVRFSPSRTNDSALAKTRGFQGSAVRRVAYRPLDNRFLLNSSAFVDWPRRNCNWSGAMKIPHSWRSLSQQGPVRPFGRMPFCLIDMPFVVAMADTYFRFTITGRIKE
jgi:hypothetical protein